MLYVRSVGVIGAGAMGSQIAEIMAMNGYDVYLKDISKEFLDRGMANIKRDLDGLVNFHKSKADREIARIKEQDGVELSEDQKQAVKNKLKATYDEKRASEFVCRIHPTENYDP